MSATPQASSNVEQVVPFFRIVDMDRSLRFYIDGLGFTMKRKWVVNENLRWCWLELGGAALMLQTFENDGHPTRIPAGKLGEGVSSNSNAATQWLCTANLSLAVCTPRNQK